MGLLSIFQPFAPPYTIVNNGNTQVLHVGSSVYSIEKTAGGAGWNAGAVSAASISGDFILRIKARQTNLNFFVGVNTDPLTDNSYASIDRGIHFVSSTALSMYENGSIQATPAVYSTSDYVFIKRTGSAITVHKGLTTDIADASLIYTFTSLSGDLYFDSSFDSVGAVAEVLFYALENVSGSTSVLFAPSGTLTGAGSLTGATTLTFAPSGTVTGKGALTGSSTLVLSPSGTLTGKGALTGTASLVFAPAGALGGLGALSGSSVLSFTLAGLLEDAGGGIDQITGSTAITFSASGNIVGIGGLSGSAALAFTLSGSLSTVDIWTVTEPAAPTFVNDNPASTIWTEIAVAAPDYAETAPGVGTWIETPPSTGTWN